MKNLISFVTSLPEIQYGEEDGSIMQEIIFSWDGQSRAPMTRPPTVSQANRGGRRPSNPAHPPCRGPMRGAGCWTVKGFNSPPVAVNSADSHKRTNRAQLSMLLLSRPKGRPKRSISDYPDRQTHSRWGGVLRYVTKRGRERAGRQTVGP